MGPEVRITPRSAYCRYVLRPPFAQERLRLRGDGRIALELKTAWRDGTRELVFDPLEFLERLAAMTPLWQRLLGRLVPDIGGLCQGAGGHDGGERCRRVLMLPTLPRRCPGLVCRSAGLALSAHEEARHVRCA